MVTQKTESPGWSLGTDEMGNNFENAPTESESPTELEARWRRIRRKMLARSYLLQKQGAVQPKVASSGRTTWELRFRETDRHGQRRYRAIYIGRDDEAELVDRVGKYLKVLRRRGNWGAEARTMATFAGKLNRRLGVRTRRN